MGLDVYLYRYEDYEATRKREDAYKEASEKIWDQYPAYDKMTDTQKEEARARVKKYADEHGLTGNGDDVSKKKIEISHPDFPEHMFKIGYFRSSYNDSGIDHILRNFGLGDLASLFGSPEDYVFRPNWEEAKARTTELLRQFREAPALRVGFEDPNVFSGGREYDLITSEEEALKHFTTQIQPKTRIDAGYKGGFSNLQATSFGSSGLKILAFIKGKGFGDVAGVYFVYEDSSRDWYYQALEIIIATCDWVLEQPDKDHYYLHWSS